MNRKSIWKIFSRFLLITVFITTVIKVYLISTHKGPLSGFMWDEYIFIVSAKNIRNGFGYTSDRPPFLPILILLFFQIFGENLTIVKYIIPAFSVINIFLIYYFASILYDKKIGLISSLLFSTLPVPFFLSTRILTETFFLMFFLSSLITFYLGLEKNVKYFLLTGIFTALSLLTRYTGAILFIIYFSYIFLRKKFKIFFCPNLLLSLIFFLLVLSPWFLVNIQNYSNPIGSLIENLEINRNIKTVEAINLPFLNLKISFPPLMYYFFVLPLIGSILSLTTLLYFLFFRKIEKEEILLLLIFFAIFIFHLISVGRASVRFLNEISIIFSIFSALFFVKIFKIKEKKFFILIFSFWFLNLLLSITTVVWYSNNREILENPNFELYMKTWEYLKKNLPRGSIVLTNLEPVVEDAGGNAVSIIFNEKSFKQQLKFADYVLVSMIEPTWNEIRFVEEEKNLLLVHKIDGAINFYKVQLNLITK